MFEFAQYHKTYEEASTLNALEAFRLKNELSLRELQNAVHILRNAHEERKPCDIIVFNYKCVASPDLTPAL